MANPQLDRNPAKEPAPSFAWDDPFRLDDQLSDEAIDRQLLALEAAALDRGKALGAGFAYPVTVKTVARWAQGLERRGYQLAPASVMTKG